LQSCGERSSPLLPVVVAELAAVAAQAQNKGRRLGHPPDDRPRAWRVWRFLGVSPASTELLLLHGFKIYRPQLTGEGERVHLARPDIGLETHIQDVVNTILYEDLHDIVLVGPATAAW